jgi:transposase-like protein
MALIQVKCPLCKETKVVKHGHTENGTQRYQCTNKDCPKNTFLLDYDNKAYEPGIDAKIIEMAANSSGIRDTARVLGISKQKVQDTLKKHRQSLSRSTQNT